MGLFKEVELITPPKKQNKINDNDNSGPAQR